jgi:ABC-type antimicrobial peptide transport system permease subunit
LINNYAFKLRDTPYYLTSFSLGSVEKFEHMNLHLKTMLFTVVFFMFVIDVILIYSIMLNDVEERTYEFAMLRTLGFKKFNLVVLLVI